MIVYSLEIGPTHFLSLPLSLSLSVVQNVMLGHELKVVSCPCPLFPFDTQHKSMWHYLRFVQFILYQSLFAPFFAFNLNITIDSAVQ